MNVEACEDGWLVITEESDTLIARKIRLYALRNGGVEVQSNK